MPLDLTVFDADLKAVIADMPATFRFRLASGEWHAEVSCAESFLRKEVQLPDHLAGQYTERDTAVLVPVSECTEEPVSDRLAELNAVAYRITDVSISEDRVQYQVSLRRTS